jgi:subtilase family serine protease
MMNHAARVESLESRTLLSASIEALEALPTSAAQPLITNSTPTGYTPAQIRKSYGFDQVSFSNGTVAGDGTGQTIAIVTAYDDPKIASDLALFSQNFNLVPMDGLNGNPTLTVSKQMKHIQSNAGWALETSLDVEWAHAIAPKANILLVEARSASLGDLLGAVDTARKTAGVSVVSMSWGAGEFSSETSYDSYFRTPSGHAGVTFVAASGDNGAPGIWPAASPNVVSVGGTSLSLDSSGNYLGESAWSGSGGGISLYEAKPDYQSLVTLSATKRVTPDIAYNADPNTGFPVYDTVSYNGQSGWFQVGGTSAGSPQIAATMAITNQGRALASKSSLDGRTQTLPMLYAAPSTDFHDIISGTSTGSPNYSADTGFDLTTGLGSPFADKLIQDLLA